MSDSSCGETDGAKLVNAIAQGSLDKLQEVVNGMNPDELQQVYVDINKANAERQSQSLPPVILVLNDQDKDGHVDVSGTNPESGKTIATEGK